MNLVSPGEYSRRLQARLRRAFTQEFPPHQTAMSLSLGIFLMALPNLGVSVLLLGAIGYRYDWINRMALLAAVMILNPLAKGTVYVVSFGLGATILGPIPGVSASDVSLSAGTDVLVRLFLGNLLFAAGLAAAGYAVALYGVHATRRRRS
ncbi:DUF2062 domain-containing protein [Halobacteriaceae archaeon SHR40]|uniref:DUF2062 domain-containing protein n=1 Tax=Halovenus amylolytica TaxID=2500550 RepID=UPI000FE3280C